MSKVMVMVFSLFVAACSGRQIVPDNLRADMQPGKSYGTWEQPPEVLFSPSLTTQQQNKIQKEILEIEETVECRFNAREMTKQEERLHLVYGILYGAVVITNDDPMIPTRTRRASTEIFTIHDSIIAAEVRFQDLDDPIGIRHEIVHALSGTGDIPGGNPELLMSTANVPKFEEIEQGNTGIGTKLLPEEINRFVCTRKIEF